MKSRVDFWRLRSISTGVSALSLLAAGALGTASISAQDKPKTSVLKTDVVRTSRGMEEAPAPKPTPAPPPLLEAAPRPAPPMASAPAPRAEPVEKPSVVRKPPSLPLTDYLTNGDFEEAMEVTPTDGEGRAAAPKVISAAGWTTLLGKLPEVVTWGNDPKEAPRKGGRFLRVTDDSPQDSVAIESVRLPAQAGVNYGASVWVRTFDKGDPALYLNFYDAEGERLRYKVGQALSSGPYPQWTNLRAVMEAPRRSVSVSIALYSFPKDVGAYDFDDAILGPIGTGGQLPEPLPEPPPPPAIPEEKLPTVLNWHGKSEAPTAGVAAPSSQQEPAPVAIPTEEERAQAEAAAQAETKAREEAQAQALATGNTNSTGGAVTDEEKRALGIEPLSPLGEEEGGAPGMRLKPRPNKELPPPWIMPKGEAQEG